ncbi:UNVERIFIED_CONTAM: hypothetical protein FKN15_000729 [Acipenser sinensis]
MQHAGTGAVRHNRDTIAKGSSDPSKTTIGLITIDWNRVFPGSPILAKWGVVSCTAVGLALVLGLVLWYKCVYKRKKRRKEEEDEEIGAQLKRERKEEEMKETERGEEEEGEGEEGGVETETGGEGEEQGGAVVEKATGAFNKTFADTKFMAAYLRYQALSADMNLSLSPESHRDGAQ